MNYSHFCSCTSTHCPNHPSHHDRGCTPCIAKNLQEGEIPSCFFNAVSGHDDQGSYHYADFAREVLKQNVANSEQRLCEACCFKETKPETSQTDINQTLTVSAERSPLENSMSVEPDWTRSLRDSLNEMALRLNREVVGWKVPEYTYKPEDYGYQKGEKATRYIQQAINAAAVTGGRVLLSSGDYVSGTLILKSHVSLEIGAGARLVCSTDLADYPAQIAKRRTVQDTAMASHFSLIFAENCEEVAICGKGQIWGQGEKFDGSKRDGAKRPGRPFCIRILDSKKVHIHDITMVDSPCWMQNYLHCQNVLIENITVENQANFNNDGCDIDGCTDVIVRNCFIRSGDDALCFKGASQRDGENILVENNTFLSCCNAVKFGTDSQGSFRNVLIRYNRIGGMKEEERRFKFADADSGISWEAVDGGTVEKLWIHDNVVEMANTPFFLRIDKRGKVKPEDPPAPIGKIRQILFENITGQANGSRGSYFLGIPERSIEDVVLKNIHLTQKASEKEVLSPDVVGEMYGIYPDAHMIDKQGDSPAYGLWTRHCVRISRIEYQVIPTGTDPRPEYILEEQK